MFYSYGNPEWGKLLETESRLGLLKNGEVGGWGECDSSRIWGFFSEGMKMFLKLTMVMVVHISEYTKICCNSTLHLIKLLQHIKKKLVCPTFFFEPEIKQLSQCKGHPWHSLLTTDLKPLKEREDQGNHLPSLHVGFTPFCILFGVIHQLRICWLGFHNLIFIDQGHSWPIIFRSFKCIYGDLARARYSARS